MIIDFTEEELKWLDTEPDNWHVKEDAPPAIKASIERKLEASNKMDYDPEEEAIIMKFVKEHENLSQEGGRLNG